MGSINQICTSTPRRKVSFERGHAAVFATNRGTRIANTSKLKRYPKYA